jgi:hypothetical protein
MGVGGPVEKLAGPWGRVDFIRFLASPESVSPLFDEALSGGQNLTWRQAAWYRGHFTRLRLKKGSDS